MKEIGGYLELDNYNLPMLHEDAIALNCGRNALAYLIESKNIKSIYLPYFLCDSVKNVCNKYNVQIKFYHIKDNFEIEDLEANNEWIYVVNYYGQLSREYMYELKKKYNNIILDNAQAYFNYPLKKLDTIYTCRKFFGVSDGAFLYTDKKITRNLEFDESFERIKFILGRYEREASQFYNDSVENNKLFMNEPIKKMSKLTYNLLHAIDYKFIKDRRNENFEYLNEHLKSKNLLKVKECEGPYMYPFMIKNSEKIKKNLLLKKIYIPTLWPNVINEMDESTLEYKYAKNILPIPCDQRYSLNEMKIIIEEIMECID